MIRCMDVAKEWNLCDALLGRTDSPSIYPHMTHPMRCPIIIPSFMSNAHTLQEEFTNRQNVSMKVYT